MILRQGEYYRPTRKQLDYASAIAREIRERHPDHPSASSLAKNYEINDLLAARDALRRGEQVTIA